MTPDLDHDHDDLAWLAFRYVAGELTTEEAGAFEQQLDCDQKAREAVAEAVALVGSLGVGVGTRPRVFPIRPVVAVLASAVAVAACLMLALGNSSLAPGARRPVAERASASASVALTWSGLRQEAEDDHHELLAWLDESSNDAASEPAGGESADALDAPPAWLIDAASLGDAAPAVSPGY